MSDTVLKHPLIVLYLRQLDAACLTLPAAQARELREQIAAHLNEALPAGATTDEVGAELSQLGSPRALAAALAGPGQPPFFRRLRNWLGHVRWWAWVSAAVVIAVVGSRLGYVLLALNATPLRQGHLSSWYYPQDRALSVMSQAGNATQYTVPKRFDQEQGLLIGVVNDSDWTQTVVSVAPDWRPFTEQLPQIAVGSGKWADLGSAVGPVRWSSPGSIPPHSMRLLRLLWNSDLCTGGPGSTAGLQGVLLTVRVGSFNRAEEIPLSDTWALSGTKESECH